MPSAPCTTHARSEPRRRSDRARSSVNSGRGTPTSWREAPAGFVSGPSRLKAVRTPSARRAAAACFIEGWNVGAKKNPMPASSSDCSTAAGGHATVTPSASNTSALPERLETDRLPCFATRTPAAATTSAAHDEMLNVPDRSPPVPHVSNTCSCLRASGTACCRIVRASPTISAGRSPFITSAIRNPASCASGTCPAMTWSMKPAASSVVRSSRRMSVSIRVEKPTASGVAISPAVRRRSF